MATSDVQICNLALGHLGEGTIASLSETTVAGRACNLYYAQTRDEVLRSHRWNFAQKRATLSRGTAPAFGWEYNYGLPSDCLRVLEINDTEIGDMVSDEYLIEGRAILTNADALNLVYVAQITTVTLYDPLFVEALAVKLAIKLTERIRGTTGKTAELVQLYQSITAPLARRVDANEGRRRKGLLPMNSLAIRARSTGV